MLTVLKELAAWRESRAQRKDTPRQNVIKDDLLLNIAALCPTSIEELEQIRNMRKEVATGKLGNEIIEVLNAARQIPASQYVKLPKERPLPEVSPAGAFFRLPTSGTQRPVYSTATPRANVRNASNSAGEIASG